MLQSKMLDMVIGLDIHVVLVPAPPAPPVPTPIPMPYIGMIFDPLGLAIGSAISTALSGNPGVVLVNGMPVTNCGTEVMNRLTLPHVFAPGTSFAMGTPPGNAELYFGSNKVSLGGSYGVRLGDVALSCCDPVRLPMSRVLALPAGPPVLNMSPMVPDVAAMAMAAAMRGAMRGVRAAGGRLFRVIRRAQRASGLWRGLARRAHNLVDNLAPQRLRSALHRGACFLTGHPVDVATGRVLTDAVDAELPGPLPLKMERSYDSSLSWRDGPLGRGWSHSLDQAVWTEPEKVVYRAPDGREIEFQLYDLPEMALGRGECFDHPTERLTLRNMGERWEIETREGVVHVFGPVIGREGESPLLCKRTRDGHEQHFSYDAEGRLARVADACGRELGFDYDAEGRLETLWAPDPEGQGRHRHRQYEYSAEGDLTEVKDALGASWRYDYDGHLLVQETDRTGLSFYFQYDYRGPFANCIRTWGDGGIYDHEISYDKPNRRTIVTNSRLHTTVYEMNPDGLVVEGPRRPRRGHELRVRPLELPGDGGDGPAGTDHAMELRRAG